MEWLKLANLIISAVCTVCYLYQFFYLAVALFKKPKTYPATKQDKRYAVLIAGRNESKVIGNLIDTINEQDYPTDLVSTFVVADNCNDNTLEVATLHGAEAWERHDADHVGKGFALHFLLKKIDEKYGLDHFDGYFIVDADNLLNQNYITEMDKCFCAGNRIVTSFRNSKNYGDNWISAGCGLYYVRDCRFLNNPRNLLGTSCTVSGTGFLVSKDIFIRQGGWQHFLMTEDYEFTVSMVLAGEKIAYCHSAVLYDEQPVKFGQSWRQRIRWVRGNAVVFCKYGPRLLKGMFKGNFVACYDMFMSFAPAYFLSLICLLFNLFIIVLGAVLQRSLGVDVILSGLLLFGSLFGYLLLFGMVTGIAEWKNLHCSPLRKIWSFFTFPLFMATYLPIAVASLFAKSQWKPIEHGVAVSLKDVLKKKKK